MSIDSGEYMCDVAPSKSKDHIIRIKVPQSTKDQVDEHVANLPYDVTLTVVYGRLLSWYLDQGLEFQKQFHGPRDRTKTGARPVGSKDSKPRKRRTKAELGKPL